MEFEPWETYKQDGSVTNIPIDEPPCKHCKYWKPQVEYITIEGLTGNQFDGVRLCWSSDMHHDFSCFKHNYTVSENQK